jgi:hypothetical protein
MTEKNADRPIRSPLTSEEQEYPVPERPTNTQEEAGESLQEMDDPPQAEGDRDEGDQ